MNEYEINFTNGTKAYVYAERYVIDNKKQEVIFYQGKSIIKQFNSNNVISVDKIWPEEQ